MSRRRRQHPRRQRQKRRRPATAKTVGHPFGEAVRAGADRRVRYRAVGVIRAASNAEGGGWTDVGLRLHPSSASWPSRVWSRRNDKALRRGSEGNDHRVLSGSAALSRVGAGTVLSPAVSWPEVDGGRVGRHHVTAGSRRPAECARSLRRAGQSPSGPAGAAALSDG